MRILVIEDEQKALAYIKKGLEEAGYSVDTASDGAEGLILAREENDHGRMGRAQKRSDPEGDARSVPDGL
jgi:CheY-like chemotaxis protein